MLKRPGIFLGIIVSLIFFLGFGVRAKASVELAEPHTLASVEHYLDALIAGDIAGMESQLSPNLLQKKAPVLNSPSYGDMLRSIYRNAFFEITGAKSTGNSRVMVDATITLDSGRLMKTSFILVRDPNGNYLIDEEVE